MANVASGGGGDHIEGNVEPFSRCERICAMPQERGEDHKLTCARWYDRIGRKIDTQLWRRRTEVQRSGGGRAGIFGERDIEHSG